MSLKRIISMLLVLAMTFGLIAYVDFGAPPVKAAYKEAVGEKINYATGGTATANDEEKSGTVTWSASRAIDGVVNRDQTNTTLQSRWSTNRDQSIGEKNLTIDLGAVRGFDEIIIEWERDNVIGFYVAVSVDGKNYTTVHTRDSSLGALSNLTYTIDLKNETYARYVKLGATKYTGWENVSVYEIMVCGYMRNLALESTASVSGSETEHHSGAKAIDGIINRNETVNNSQSRWSSNVALNEDKWIRLDFGKKTAMESVVLEWERLNATAYKIQYSDNGTSWTDVASFSATPTLFRQIINFNTPVYARYIRLLVTDFTEAGTAFNGSTTRWKNVSVWEFEVYPVKNLAYNSTITANASETSDFVPTFANDGIVNRENETLKEQSRWASSVGINQKWLRLDFGSAKTVSSVVIEWERLNAISYKIQYSTNGTSWSDAATFTSKPTSFRQAITFPKVSARYIRLLISDFAAQAEIYNGASYNWQTVSVYEFEAYGVGMLGYTLADVISGVKLPKINKGDKKMALPEVPKGFTIELLGADYEQIIDSDLTIHQPIVDTKVTLNYKIGNGATYVETESYEITVPGKYSVSASDNKKPIVIPELAEWKGHTGNFKITDSTRLVINPDHKSALSFVAESFKADYSEVTGKDIEIVYSKTPSAGDFYFTLGSADAGLKEEGYIMTIADYVTVEAVEKTGAFWAVQTVMQIFERNGDTIPKGITRDYPKFKVRGFMLDVGRKPFTLDYLYEVVKTMAYYKLNDFGVHLNDNYIWLEDYNDTATDQWGGYSAFRLESDIKAGGKNKADLTSTDLYYTKAEFCEFIQWARNLGVDVVPEIDTPAHALALTKVRPDLAIKEDSVTRWADHMDLANPETEEFVKSIWNEYMTGTNPVFDKDTILNIGTDEYEGNNNDFRQYSANMINFVQGSGRTVRMWGSLSRKSGSVAVPSKDVQLYIWNTSWSNPAVMYSSGYNIINIQDSYVYMVPNGTNNRGAYKDRLDLQNIYENWTPNVIGTTTIPVGSDRILGGSFAIWNDNVDRRDNGLGEYDLFDRFIESAPYIATKAWGDGEDMTYSEFSAVVAGADITAPGTNPFSEVESKSSTVAKYTFDDGKTTDISGNYYSGVSSKNVSYVTDNGNKALYLGGGESYVTTPIADIGPQSQISFRIKADANSSGEQIIFQSEKAAIKAYQKDTGKFGYSRDYFNYSFNYVLPKGVWVDITIKGYEYKTELYVNGTLTDTLAKNATGKYYATGVIPLATIGSKTNAFKGMIDDIVVTDPSKSSEKSALLELYCKLENTARQNNYSEDEWITFENAKSNAYDVIENSSSTQMEIQIAYNSLNSAFENLGKTFAESWEYSEETQTLYILKNCGNVIENFTPWFKYADDITKVVVNEGVVALGDYTLSGLDNVTEISLPSSLLIIGSNCITNESLKTVYFYGTQAQFDLITVGAGNTAVNNADVICMCDFVIRTASVAINNNLSVNFKAYKYLFEQAGYANPVLTVDGKEITEYTIDGDMAVFTVHGIAPHKMGDTISVTLSAGNADNSLDFVIADYLKTLMSGYSDNAELVTLCIDALNYGAQAQIYKNYNTDTLVNASLAESQKIVRDPGSISNDISITNAIEETALWKSHALYLEDSVQIKLTFETEQNDVYVVVKNADGETVQTVTDFRKTPYGRYYFYFDNMNMHQIDEVFTFTVMQGETPVSETLSYSVQSYANFATGAEADLVKSLVAYGRSAYTYAN